MHPQLFWAYRGEVHPMGRYVTTQDTKLTAWWMLAGWVEVRCGHQVRRATAGQWMFPPNIGRIQRFSQDARILSISFRIDWPGGQSLYEMADTRILEAKAMPELGRAAIALCETVERMFPQASNHLFLETGTLDHHWEIHWAFAEWLRIHSRAMTRMGLTTVRPYSVDARLAKALLLIEQHALNRPFRQTALAKSTGLSVSHLNRLFTQHLGKPPRERYEERRLQAAVMLLEQSVRPMKTISADLGFSSPAHFTRWFKHRLKRTPGEYRQQYFQRGDA